MKLIMKGTEIPKKKHSLHMLGDYVDKLVMDGTLVWESFGGRQTFLINGTFTVPVGIYTIRVCGVAGGGGGTDLLGGSAGEIISNVDLPVNPLDEVSIVIGTAGTNGGNGGETKIGTITLHGGVGGSYEGDGAIRTSCGGTRYDGLVINTYFGGQASPFADGGAGDGVDGVSGSGGGAGATGSLGSTGRVVIRW